MPTNLATLWKMELWMLFWVHLRSVMQQCERHYLTSNQNLAEQLLMRLEDCECVLRALLGRAAEDFTNGQLIEDLEHILTALHRYSEHIEEWTLIQLGDTPRTGMNHETPPIVETTGRGRPPYDISRENLESLLELGFSFQQMASILGVSVRTIRRRRELFGLPIGVV